MKAIKEFGSLEGSSRIPRSLRLRISGQVFWALAFASPAQ